MTEDDVSLDTNVGLEPAEAGVEVSVLDEVTRTDKPFMLTVGPELEVVRDEGLFETGCGFEFSEMD